MAEKGTHINSVRQDTATILITNILLIWRGTFFEKYVAKGYAIEIRLGTTVLVLVLRMCGAKPLFTIYTFMAWRRKTLHLHAH